MVTPTHWLRLVCIGTVFSLAVLHAKDLTAYRIGDTAEENITTPVALDVIDADATAARKAAEALKTPAIFRSYPNPTNAMVREFTAAFAKERAEFTASLKSALGEITNADETVASPEFAKLVTAFNRKKIAFPITAGLAGVWAQGDAGTNEQAGLVTALLQMTHRPIRPDNQTNGLVLGETLRLVPVESPGEPLTLADAEQRGKLVTLTSVTTVTRLRDLFRRNFPLPEQPMARGIGKFLRTNCDIDTNLTLEARNRDVSQMVVVNHYNAGQVIVQRGGVIDANVLAALAQLNEKMMPDRLSSQLAAQQEQLQREQTQAQVEQARAEAEKAAALKTRDQQLALQNESLAARTRNEWLVVGVAGIFVAALVAFGILTRNRRREPSLLPARMEASIPQPQNVIHATLAPQIAQVLKEAVVQGLAAQRSELLQAQQAAAAEISELVHRLDELKAPMQERLRSYESRIVELEKDLAERNEENRELLKLKIEMTRRQLEAERARNRVGFN